MQLQRLHFKIFADYTKNENTTPCLRVRKAPLAKRNATKLRVQGSIPCFDSGRNRSMVDHKFVTKDEKFKD
jgi:hypothetical protein